MTCFIRRVTRQMDVIARGREVLQLRDGTTLAIGGVTGLTTAAFV